VVAIPSTKYFCREKNRIKGGIIDSVKGEGFRWCAGI
jgi:hypothetical protein